ncbi:hypothetical protein OG716_21650 [Nocardia sp. NBC_01388]
MTADDKVVFLVRPDGNIGLTTEGDIAEQLNDYLSRIAGPPA